MRFYSWFISAAACAACVLVFNASAQAASEFRSPTGNLMCGWTAAGEVLRVQTLICATRNDSFAVMLPGNARARGGYTSVRLPSNPRSVLRYGRTWRHGVFTCSMHRMRGVTCFNRAGRGFTLNRENFTHRRR